MASNESLVARRQAAVARGVSMVHPVFIERAENALLWDAEGRRYVDFAGGIAVLNTGHRHPQRARGRARAARQGHPHLLPGHALRALRRALRAAERARARQRARTRRVLMSTGAEAVENAVKIARAAHGALGRDRLRRRLPRPHDDGARADRQGRALQGGLRPVPGRDLSRAVPECAARRVGRRCAATRSP